MMQLYHYKQCPFCAKVRQKFDDLGLKEGEDYELIDAERGTPGSEKLLELGGKQQVPFLVDEGVKMYESDDIIRYVSKRFSDDSEDPGDDQPEEG